LRSDRTRPRRTASESAVLSITPTDDPLLLHAEPGGAPPDAEGDPRVRLKIAPLLRGAQALAPDLDDLVSSLMPKLTGTTCGPQSAPAVASRPRSWPRRWAISITLNVPIETSPCSGWTQNSAMGTFVELLRPTSPLPPATAGAHSGGALYGRGAPRPNSSRDSAVSLTLAVPWVKNWSSGLTAWSPCSTVP
jgi:hypothetical protein